MTTRNQITGVGPTKMDGSCYLFTTLPNPYKVSLEWLQQQTKHPAVGDYIEVSDQGALTVVSTLGLAAGAGLAPETAVKPYQAIHPATVYAAEITEVTPAAGDGQFICGFADGTEKFANIDMTAGKAPMVGDYWATESLAAGAVQHLVAKADFEREFALVQE